MESSQAEASAGAEVALQSFTLFPALPAELRVKIWQQTFRPRILELHSKRGHHMLPPSALWCSNCGNPVALSVCRESREEALIFHPVALPLGDKNGEHTKRLLYLDPAVDTVVLLGTGSYERLKYLFDTLATLDPAGIGFQRIGLSLSSWGHRFAREMLQLWSRTLFKDLEQFVLLMYTESQPPANFRSGECAMEDCEGMDRFLRLTMGHGSKLKSGDSWMVVGKTEMRVVYLNFVTGPWTC